MDFLIGAGFAALAVNSTAKWSSDTFPVLSDNPGSVIATSVTMVSVSLVITTSNVCPPTCVGSLTSCRIPDN